MSNGIRAATLADAAAVQNVSLAAYRAAYEAALGYVPKPGLEDYRPRIECGEVFVAEDASGLTGVLVLERHPNGLMIYSVAVAPAHQGASMGADLFLSFDRRAVAHLTAQEIPAQLLA